MTNLKYKLENADGTKTITINNVRSDIDSQTAIVTAFADKISGYSAGDYALAGVFKIVTEETEIDY